MIQTGAKVHLGTVIPVEVLSAYLWGDSTLYLLALHISSLREGDNSLFLPS